MSINLISKATFTGASLQADSVSLFEEFFKLILKNWCVHVPRVVTLWRKPLNGRRIDHPKDHFSILFISNNFYTWDTMYSNYEKVEEVMLDYGRSEENLLKVQNFIHENYLHEELFKKFCLEYEKSFGERKSSNTSPGYSIICDDGGISIGICSIYYSQ